MSKKISFSVVVLNFLLFLGLGICFALPYARGEILYFRDIFHNYYPLIDFMKTSLLAGELPFWNPFLFTGTPQMAGLEPALFYPPAWPFFLLDFSDALYVNLICHYFWAAWGLFLFLRQHRLNSLACVLGGLTWALSGTMINLNNMHPLLNTIVWLPWLLFLLHKFCTVKTTQLRWRYGALFSAFYGFQILSGHLELVYASSLLVAAYFGSLYWQGKTTIFQALPFFCFVVLGITLSSIQLLPSMAYQQESARMFGLSLIESQSFSAHPLSFLNIWISRFSGDLQTSINLQRAMGDPVLKHNLLFSSYLGVLGCTGLTFSFFVRRKEVYFWWMVTVCCAFFSLGSYTPIYSFFWKYFPGISLFRYPEKGWLLLSFSFSILSAWGIHLLTEENQLLTKKRFNFVFLGLLVLSVCGLCNVQNFAAIWVELGEEPLRVTVDEWISVYSHHLFSSFLILVVGLGCFWLLLLWFRKSNNSRQVGLLILLLATLDLTYNAQYYLWYAERNLFDVKPQVVSFLEERLSSQYRYFMTKTENRIPAYFVELYENARIEEALFRRAYMEDNQGVLFRFRSVDGFWPAKPARSTVTLSLYNRGETHSYFDRIYESLWGVKYIMLVSPTPESLARLKSSALHRRVAQYGQTYTYVYENTKALPRARFQTDYIAVPRLPDMFAIWENPEKYGYDYTKHILLLEDEKFEEAKQRVAVQKADVPEWSSPTFLEEHNNSLRIGFETNTSGFLVLADQYMPGWKAYDNGQEVPILQANFSQRALRVGPGKHDIRFEYEPPGFAWGWKISLLSGLLLLLILGASFRYKTDLQPSAY